MNCLKSFQLISAIKIISAVAVIFLICCSPNTGGGSEAGNAKIVGRVNDNEGKPAANTVVTLLPSDYNPVIDAPIADTFIDTTDTDGCYRFTVAENRSFSIEVVQQKSRLRALITGVALGSKDDTIPGCVLSLPGAIRMISPDGSKIDSGYVFISGTTFFARVKTANGYVIIDSVPSGVCPGISFLSANTSTSFVVRENVVVTPGDTTIVPWNNWQHSQEIVLNTSASGAEIKENIFNFPVLIRLPGGTFKFNQSQSNGADLRFTSKDGKMLPCEIEQWDSAGDHADIWVKVDTIRSDNASQSIIMYWGNPSAVAPTNHRMVFDTSDGFEGVWHMDERPGDRVIDATINHYNGTSPDTASPEHGNGIIGSSRIFDGTKDFITMPNTADSRLNFKNDGYFTVSAWVSLDSLDNMPHLIVAKGYTQYFLRCTYFPSNTPLWEFSEFTGVNSWETCTSAAYAHQWALITGVHAGNRHLLYCNGILVDSIPDIYQSPTLSQSMSNDISIGRFMDLVTLPNDTSGYCFFKGAIDEVRIDRNSRSNGWIKLCYMNQRSDDRLLEFKQKAQKN